MTNDWGAIEQRVDVLQLLEMTREILALHRPMRFASTPAGCIVCREVPWHGGPLPIPYPCPTVQAIQRVIDNV